MPKNQLVRELFLSEIHKMLQKDTAHAESRRCDQLVVRMFFHGRDQLHTPFSDVRLFEAARTIPAEYLFCEDQNKYAFRKAAIEDS